MKFDKVKKKFKSSQLKSVIKILRSENKNSILANLSDNNIKNYLSIVINSNDMELFVIKNPSIIGYAITARRPKCLLKNFEKLKLKFFFDLLIRFKLFTLINVFISIVGFDSLFLKKKEKKLINLSTNLNLLGVHKQYQGSGIGTNFMRYILKRSTFKSKFITCETNNFRSLKFYKVKLNFKILGYKIRFPRFLEILVKKY